MSSSFKLVRLVALALISIQAFCMCSGNPNPNTESVTVHVAGSTGTVDSILASSTNHFDRTDDRSVVVDDTKSIIGSDDKQSKTTLKKKVQNAATATKNAISSSFSWMKRKLGFKKAKKIENPTIEADAITSQS
ncbi:hypothetical protein NEHOM01_1752 [Nematocida homosporus]|uniref:uncharacterized protein n=1 Tax=Nematocida homosporus TaxID=1912981 RepID=UPI002220DC6C|nr:uncharacterized protein NEHOM01_1752 [Nematocida homosporus]KAI5186857.1 hypothetical protein NEHOM01_1752 [Nematocida homosporus]